MTVYGRIWRYMEVYGGIWRHMEVYGGIWRYMEVYGGPRGVAAADELIPSELYHEGGMRIIKLKHNSHMC